MFYPVRFEESDAGVLVIVRDLDLTLTYSSIQEARESAALAVIREMEAKFRKKRLAIPKPTKPKAGEEVFYIPIKIQARILLWNEMVKRRMRAIDLAKLLDTSPAQAQRYINGSNDVSIESYEKALMKLNIWLNLKAH